MRRFAEKPGTAPDDRVPLARDRRGILLLEALVALAIVGIVAVALLGATGGQVRAADRGTGMLVASALAQDRATTFRILDHDELRRPPDSLMAGDFPEPLDAFGWAATLEPVEGEYDLFALEVVVEGRGVRFPLQTLLHRAPLAVEGEVSATPLTPSLPPPPPPPPEGPP
ncbi:hypothetical protein BH23GEM11_BH23GEM11_18830 [soil metagenome]